MSYKRTFTKAKASSKKRPLPFDEGILFFTAVTKNLILSLTNLQGRVFMVSSGGKVGFKNVQKKTALASEMVVQGLLEEGISRGLKRIHVRCRGFSFCRNVALRYLINHFSSGIEIIDFEDVTRLPHGGCRARKVRRT